MRGNYNKNNTQTAVTNIIKQRMFFVFYHVCDRSLCIISVKAEMAETQRNATPLSFINSYAR